MIKTEGSGDFSVGEKKEMERKKLAVMLAFGTGANITRLATRTPIKAIIVR